MDLVVYSNFRLKTDANYDNNYSTKVKGLQ